MNSTSTGFAQTITNVTNPTKYPVNRIYCERNGSAPPPVLILHGWGGNCRSLMTLRRLLATKREVIALDLPGFGSSPPPPNPWGTFDYVQAIAQWFDTEVRQPVSLIGHSFGGRIAIGLAARYPETVRDLILIASAGIKPRRTLKTWLKIKLSRSMHTVGNTVGGNVKKTIDHHRNGLGSPDWRSASPVMKGTLSRVILEDLSNELSRITAPTTLIWGTEDRDTPLWMGQRMQNLLPDAELIILENAGHYCFLDQPSEVITAIWKRFGLESAW